MHEIVQAFQAADGSLAQGTQSLATGIRADIGEMTNLQTQEKATLVGAVNEVTSALALAASEATLGDLEGRVAANEDSLNSQTEALETETNQRKAGDMWCGA